ncbi:endolytic transglycosylase MltG [Bacillus sp. FJAT-45350]|uniref:endolytic transglycosylase MltG n=1 Tax=Bacillus sp. FJAT-45350 TaxID=2011014 RepID=UPI000BB92913|nr:endolytic transglycosylase MltG [Bacillus sp. FJAT-45350]
MTEKKDKQEYDRKYAEKVAQAKIVRKIVFFCVLAIVVVCSIALISSFLYVKSAVGPVDINDESPVEVSIPIGSSSTQIGQILENEGVIKSGTFFRYYVRYKNETGFQAGDYELSKTMSLDDIIQELKEGRVIQEPVLVFTVPEGLWISDVIEIIANNTDYEVEEIDEVLNDEDYLKELEEKFAILTEDIFKEGIKHPLEGYLFPSRYDFYQEDVSIEEIIEKMIGQTETVFFKYETDLDNSPYTIHEIMTLASIVEREAQKSEDRYLISGVLHNRLEQGMALQVDPTVAYAIGEHRYMTTFADLEIDSPYNTYRYAGVPIGPIANPGEDSIKATILPERTDYLFFYARFNGEVIYNETYQEHNRVHQQYRDEWVEGRQD